MYLLLNKDRVIIDTVPIVKYVKKNARNKCIVLTNNISEAMGVLGSSDNVIYPLIDTRVVDTQLVSSFSDISSTVEIETLPEYVQPIQYCYIDGTFVANTNYLPDALAQAKLNASAILELYIMLMMQGGV